MALFAQDAHSRIVVTCGAGGIYWHDAGVDGYVAAIPVDTVDVTGAGDTVLAEIGVALASGLSLAEACKRANRAAAEKITRLGASLSSMEAMTT